jgi:putative membrane protein
VSRVTEAETSDASRRTHLANERTTLAWWRSGLTAFAVSLGAGRVAPDLAHGATRWPYAVVGVGYGLLGIGYVAYGSRRQRAVAAAVARGEYVPPEPLAIAVLTVAALILGVATVALVAFDA